MKNSIGELGNAVIVVICVAILIAFFFYEAWPRIKTNFVSQTACEKAICESNPDSDGLVNCVLIDDSGKHVFKCNYKG